MKTKLLTLLFLSTSFAALAQNQTPERKLIFAVDVIRHGDRTPVIDIPAAHHRWPEGLGQLTPQGMHQEYELGQKFHHRYIEQEKLLPRNYQPGTLYVRSTDVDRTLMSAQCALMGLYPPGTGPFLHAAFLMNWFALPYGFQPIPIHTVPKSQDSLLATDANNAELQKMIEATPVCQKKEAELKSHFTSWSQATGLSIHNALDLEQLGDALYIYHLKHCSPPKGLSKEECNTIIEASDIIVKDSRVLNTSCGKNLLANITHHLEEAAQHPSPLKYILYSAHDSTIMNFLAAVHVSIKEIPHYASDLNISLYENKNHHFEVQIRLNDHPVSFTGAANGTCSLQDFANLSRK